MVELENVAMSYGGRTLFHDVSLRLPDGSFHFLIGPSGAGKTTLIRLFSMELKPSRGRVSLWGQDTRQMGVDDVAEMRRRIGVVHQDSRFVDHLKLSENVMLPVSVEGAPSIAKQHQLNELLDWVGLTEQMEQTPPELSGGERQRAALARAVILSPDVVLADEPTGNVDWEMSMRLLEFLIELNAMGKTIICATHDLALVRQAKSRVAARVLRLRQGQIEIAGADL